MNFAACCIVALNCSALLPRRRPAAHLADVTGNGLRFECLGQTLAEELILRIEICHPLEGVVVCIRERRRRPTGYRTVAAQYQWGVLGDGDRRFATQGSAERCNGTIQPAVPPIRGSADTVLEHILAVEMRTLSVGACSGVDDCGFAALVQLVHLGERRMQSEKPIELEHPIPAARRQRRVRRGASGSEALHTAVRAPGRPLPRAE